MLNHLIFIRHSLPILDPKVPPFQWHLSDEGKMRCRTLATHLQTYSPKMVFTSRESKAIETGQIIATYLKLSQKIIDGLHEHERPQTGNLDHEQFIASIANFFKQPDLLIFGSETADAAYKRFSKTVDKVVKEALGNNNDCVAIVTHETVISLFMWHVCHQEPFSFWQQLGIPSYLILDCPAYKIKRIVYKV